jgi:hypothetical protein
MKNLKYKLFYQEKEEKGFAEKMKNTSEISRFISMDFERKYIIKTENSFPHSSLPVRHLDLEPLPKV